MNKKKDNSNLMMTLLKGRTLFVLIFYLYSSLLKPILSAQLTHYF